MAEKARYPQIPGTVWWGVRSILGKTPNATLNDRFLSVELGVQPVAAKAYIAELIAVGILSEEGRATPLALRWRLDQSYLQAVGEIVSNIYPESLRHLAPPEEGDRQKAASWFMQEGLGQGAAGNKAATYFMLGSPKPGESPRAFKAKQGSGDATHSKNKQPGRKPQPILHRAPSSETPAVSAKPASSAAGTMPLNVNIQIHISADAGSEQIESIFSAMKRYLYDQQNS